MPLIVQPARGLVRRGAQAALAVLSAVLVAGVSGADLPLTDAPSTQLGITPLDSSGEVGLAIRDALLLHPVIVAGAMIAAIAAAILPWARRRSRYGVVTVGTALLAGAIATGSGIVAVLLIALVWAMAGVIAAGTGR